MGRIKCPMLVRAEKSKMASKMAARYKCKRLMYMTSSNVLKHLNTPNKLLLILQAMFKLFNDEFKDGFSPKVKVKFKVKHKILRKKSADHPHFFCYSTKVCMIRKKYYILK